MLDPSFQQIYYKINANDNFYRLNGVNNLTINKNISFSEDFILGGMASALQINAPQQSEVSFDRSFIQKDSLFQFTGSSPINKMLFYNGDNYYTLNNLYLSSYSAGFTVGELPKINTKFISYGDTINQYETNSPTSALNSDFPIEIPTLKSIFLSGDSELILKYSFNIYSFEYNLEINRQPFFGVGSFSATNVLSTLPLKINFNINSKLKSMSELGDYTLDQNLILNNPPVKNKYIDIPEYKQTNYSNFNIVVTGSSNNSTILPITNAKLISTDIVFSNSTSIEVRRQFKGYYGL